MPPDIFKTITIVKLGRSSNGDWRRECCPGKARPDCRRRELLAPAIAPVLGSPGPIRSCADFTNSPCTTKLCSCGGALPSLNASGGCMVALRRLRQTPVLTLLPVGGRRRARARERAQLHIRVQRNSALAGQSRPAG